MELHARDGKPKAVSDELSRICRELDQLRDQFEEAGPVLARRMGDLLRSVSPDERDGRMGEVLRWSAQASDGLKVVSARIHLIAEVMGDSQLSDR